MHGIESVPGKVGEALGSVSGYPYCPLGCCFECGAGHRTIEVGIAKSANSAKIVVKRRRVFVSVPYILAPQFPELLWSRVSRVLGHSVPMAYSRGEDLVYEGSAWAPARLQKAVGGLIPTLSLPAQSVLDRCDESGPSTLFVQPRKSCTNDAGE